MEFTVGMLGHAHGRAARSPDVSVRCLCYATGATLSKGMCRVLATLAAGSLAVGAHLVARLCGEDGEPVLLAVFVFLVGN